MPAIPSSYEEFKVPYSKLQQQTNVWLLHLPHLFKRNITPKAQNFCNSPLLVIKCIQCTHMRFSMPAVYASPYKCLLGVIWHRSVSFSKQRFDHVWTPWPCQQVDAFPHKCHLHSQRMCPAHTTSGLLISGDISLVQCRKF